MGKDRRGGYIAIDREILDHPVLRNPHWLRAWLWLLCQATWKAEACRLSFGTAHLERGQLAQTVRGLSDKWRWSQTRVVHFLGKLQSEGMITVAAISTKRNTKNRTENSKGATLLTICNYDKYQNVGKGRSGALEQKPVQKAKQLTPDEQVARDLFHANHLTNTNQESLEAGNRNKPKDGAISRDGKWVWADFGGDLWRQYASDYESERGAAPMPKKYIGGAGDWFYKLGEALRPQKANRKRA